MITETTRMHEQLSVRADPKIRAVLERAANAERRTLSCMIRKILLDWAERQEMARSPPKRA
jgi:uncharacterized protein (DUF1778 family)